MTLRRRFRTDGRRLLDIADESLDGSIVDGAAVGDFLLEELEREPRAHMRDIVATIQADQYRLITRRPDAAARHPGRPGHRQDRRRPPPRVVPPLHAPRDARARGVLVVGPNRTFMEYVSHVLPALGEDAVEQRAVGELVDGVEAERARSAGGRGAEGRPAARRGDRAARPSCGSSREPEELVLRLEGSFVSVREREVRELLAAAREELGTTAAARERFRMSLLRALLRGVRAHARRGRDSQLRRGRAGAARRTGYLDRVLKAAGRSSRPDRLVRSAARLPRARSPRRRTAILDAAEQKLLVRARRGLVATATSRCSTRRARCSTPRRTRTAT